MLESYVNKTYNAIKKTGIAITATYLLSNPIQAQNLRSYGPQSYNQTDSRAVFSGPQIHEPQREASRYLQGNRELAQRPFLGLGAKGNSLDRAKKKSDGKGAYLLLAVPAVYVVGKGLFGGSSGGRALATGISVGQQLGGGNGGGNNNQNDNPQAAPNQRVPEAWEDNGTSDDLAFEGR